MSSTSRPVSPDELPPAPRLPTREERPRRPRQRALTREAIVEAALTIVDAEGLDALTMRTVAHALGTGAASLYAHVSSKEDLIELVVERVIGEMRRDRRSRCGALAGADRRDVREMRAVFGRHGDLARASFARIPMGENALRVTESVIGVLKAGELPDRVIALACDLLPMYAMAVAYEESLYDFEGTSVEEFDRFVDAMRDYFSGLPRDRFPYLAALAPLLTEGDNEERFDFGLEVLVRGLAAMSE